MKSATRRTNRCGSARCGCHRDEALDPDDLERLAVAGYLVGEIRASGPPVWSAVDTSRVGHLVRW